MFYLKFDFNILNEFEIGDDVREYSKESEKSESEDVIGNFDRRKQEMNEERENDKIRDDICDKIEKDSLFFDDNFCWIFFEELDEIMKKCKVFVENSQWGYLFSDFEEDEVMEELSGDEDEYGEMMGDDKEIMDSEFYDIDLDDLLFKILLEGKKIVYNENIFLLQYYIYIFYYIQSLILLVCKFINFLFILSIKKMNLSLWCKCILLL